MRGKPTLPETGTTDTGKTDTGKEGKRNNDHRKRKLLAALLISAITDEVDMEQNLFSLSVSSMANLTVKKTSVCLYQQHQ